MHAYERLQRTSLILALLIAVSLTLAMPTTASAAEASAQTTSEPTTVAEMPDTAPAEKGGLSKFFRNIGNGFKAVGRTIAGWFENLGRLLGLGEKGRPQGASCDEISDCGSGLVCLNTCFESEGCEVFEKLCERTTTGETTTIAVKPQYAACGSGDLCAAGLDCTRTCPKGVECEVKNRCLPRAKSLGSCEAASDCTAVCEGLGFPPIGPSALRPVCEASACYCKTEEVRPELNIVACSGEAATQTLVCPTGLRAICTDEGCASGKCAPRLTCLTAPAYGGQCIRDIGCQNVDCSQGTEPFCDLSDNRCRCRTTAAVTVSCSAIQDCQGISCPEGQNKACVDSVCTCEKKTVIEKDFVCTADAQCPSNCPEGFSPACVDSACACSRTRENVPISCVSVDECGGVSCPAEFEKICLDGTCACTRTVLE